MSYPTDGFSDKELALIFRYLASVDRALEDIEAMATDASFNEKEIKNFMKFLRHGYSVVSA